MKYSYDLNPKERPLNAKYTYEELAQLTTIQLREICSKEKLPIGVAFKLDRPYIIDTILKYRGTRLNTYVEIYYPERFDAVLDKFKPYLELVAGEKSIEAPTRIALFKGMDTTLGDNYIINGEKICDGNAFLLDENKNICGILNVKNEYNKFYLVCNHNMLSKSLVSSSFKNYSIGFLDENGSKYLYNFYFETENIRPTKLKCYVKNITELSILETDETNTFLVIDFGTSNTSAGVYLDEHFVPKKLQSDLLKNGISINEINNVKFTNYLSKTPEISEVIPTIISIKDCSDTNNITYRFGFDAIKNSRKNSYNSSVSIFYGIKKWINNYNKNEEVSDENGNNALVSRRDMLRAYFEYIIGESNRQHKCLYKNLHITSPIKQKQQFLNMYQEILPEYKIAIKSALDEGIAVLYNSISKQIENKKFDENVDYQALIIDCGGGTTDLTSCIYYIEDNQITYKLNMTTTYANGETNFGGDNVTYRIFQYIKILFSKYYSNDSIIKVDELLHVSSLDIYRYIDEYGSLALYDKLETLYKDSEDIIPTRFNNYKNKPTEEFLKVKSNFYFLWNLAEKIKIDFYQNVGVIQTHFHEFGIKADINDPKIYPEESWRLNIYHKHKKRDSRRNTVNESNDLSLVTELPKVVITKEEINMLIKGDIYFVIKKFLDVLYEEDKLFDFNFIKLTGQTCKIDLFRDALKEFVPGKVIESSKKEKTLQDYKLTCLEGAIKYQNAQKIGLIAPKIINEVPITPYKLIANTHTGNQVTMISSLEKLTKTYGFVSRNIDTESVELILTDAKDTVIHKYALNTDIHNFRETSYEETTSEYSEKIFQDDIDSIIDNEIKIFTFAFEDRWGFYTLPLARKNQVLLTGDKKYFPFENDEWEINFFDGQK